MAGQIIDAQPGQVLMRQLAKYECAGWPNWMRAYIISISDIIEPLEMSKPTANSLVKEFESRGILKEVTGYQKNKLFVFEKYLDIYSQN